MEQPVRVLDDWWLTPERAAVHLPTATAVVADLHLGYERARQRRGDAIPTLPLARRLAPLAALCLRCEVRSLAIAGDLFEEGRACAETAQELSAWLAETGIALAGIVPGNHDRGFDGVVGLGPVCPDGLTLGPWRIVHGDGPTDGARLVYGHWHPCVRRQGRAMPCFLVGEQSLVLPAYSVDAAGGNVRGVARWRDFRCYAIAQGQVLDLGALSRGKPRRVERS